MATLTELWNEKNVESFPFIVIYCHLLRKQSKQMKHNNAAYVNRMLAAEDSALSHSSEDEEDVDYVPLDDEDTCTQPELEQHFRVKYKIADESAVSLKKDYVLSLCSDSGFTRVAAGLSNGEVQIFDVSTTHGLQHASADCIPLPPGSVTAPLPNICGVRFLDESPNNLLIASSNGLVRLCDLRAQAEVARFEENVTCTKALIGGSRGGEVRKKINCFDCNSNGRILCTGTEQYKKNVFLLFYDVREREQLGGYYESHEDDVTALRFHTRNPELLCSGAIDGLINVFDIKQATEDDALLTTINTESSVHKLNWHKNVYEQDVLSCITQTNDMKLYLCGEGDLLAEFERSKVTAAMQRKNPANCNAVSVHNAEDGGIWLLAGTNSNKGEVLRSMLLQNKQLQPLADFVGNKQIVRESIYVQKSNVFVTGGESGIVSLWAAQASETATNSSQLKSKSIHKSNKKTPY